MSNNAPYCTLELTKEEADLLIKTSVENISMSLQLMQHASNTKNAAASRMLVNHTEIFRSIRQKLLNQGVQDED